MVPGYLAAKASTVWGGDAIGYSHGAGGLDSPRAWSSGKNAAGQWWQWNLGSAQQVRGVVTQARQNHGQYVTEFQVQVSKDGKTFTAVDGGRKFRGNTVANSDAKVNAIFIHPVAAQFVRIVVTKWVGHISMRSGVLLCKGIFRY